MLDPVEINGFEEGEDPSDAGDRAERLVETLEAWIKAAGSPSSRGRLERTSTAGARTTGWWSGSSRTFEALL